MIIWISTKDARVASNYVLVQVLVPHQEYLKWNPNLDNYMQIL